MKRFFLLLLLFPIGLGSVHAQEKQISRAEHFPGHGLQPAYTSQEILQNTGLPASNGTYWLQIHYLNFEFPENPDYTQPVADLIAHMTSLPKIVGVEEIAPPKGNSSAGPDYVFQMQGEPVGRLMFYTVHQEFIGGEQHDYYFARYLKDGAQIAFEDIFDPAAFEYVTPFLVNPSVEPAALNGNFSVMPDLMGEEVVLWLPCYTSYALLKPEVVKDPQYDGRPFVRVPMKLVKPEWHADMKDYIKFRNGH